MLLKRGLALGVLLRRYLCYGVFSLLLILSWAGRASEPIPHMDLPPNTVVGTDSGEALLSWKKFRIKASVIEVLGVQSANRYQDMIDIHRRESWRLWLPVASVSDASMATHTRHQSDHSNPKGHDQLSVVAGMVFISPEDIGLPQPQWEPVMLQRKVAWVGVDNAGNQRPVRERMILALVGRELLLLQAGLPERGFILAGMSGGGKAASQLMGLSPKRFDGALYMTGANTLADIDKSLLAILQRKRIVFLTGRKDFNRDEVKRVYRQYRRLGIHQSLFMDVTGMTHEYPSQASFTQALDFLLAPKL